MKLTSLLWRHTYIERSQSVQYFALSFTTCQVLNTIASYNFEVLPHLSYSPDLAPVTTIFLCQWRKCWVGRNSHQIRRCSQLFVSGLDSSQHRFFTEGIWKLVCRWDKCLNKLGRLLKYVRVCWKIKHWCLIFKQVSLLNVFIFLVLVTRSGVYHLASG